MADNDEKTDNQETQEAQEQITLNDLFNVLQLLDYILVQGGVILKDWQAMEQAPQVRNKLYRFLEENMPEFDRIKNGEISHQEAQENARARNQESEPSGEDNGEGKRKKEKSKGKGKGKGKGKQNG